MHQMDYIAQEVSRLETTGRKIEDQVRNLNRILHYIFSEIQVATEALATRLLSVH